MFRILMLGSRLVLASVLALIAQIYLLLNKSDWLLYVQDNIEILVSRLFEFSSVHAQYQAAYHLVNGHNLLVHTFFVLLAYILFLLLGFAFPYGRRR
ncbi:MAG: hypothetical protein AAF402_07750 [Pseudomonadota bacterium]